MLLHLLITVPMVLNTGSEFMPPLDEGSILYMPVTLPGASITEVNRILQEQDKIIKTVPEVHHVLGKTGRAETATDNAPLSMIETIIVLKPKDEWRPGITKQDIVAELRSQTTNTRGYKRMDAADHKQNKYAINRCKNRYRI
jgi:Cu(I)/Ag(I) efflux system membrane protein CusA/SilA